ncbi:hypothetical protein B0H67DRAFT_457979, partial [Lasiosphaeris hirsuta]
FSYWGFYSPGILCPYGWTTATTVAPGEVASGTDSAEQVRSLLRDDETAAFCCPQDFTIGLGMYGATKGYTFENPPGCYWGTSDGDFTYMTCDATDTLKSGMRSVHIG